MGKSGNAGGGYTTKVSFDTFMTSSEDALFSFTLQVCMSHYVCLRHPREGLKGLAYRLNRKGIKKAGIQECI